MGVAPGLIAAPDVEIGGAALQASSPFASVSLLQPIAALMAIPRLLTELLRRVTLEFRLELPMLLQRWKYIVFGLVMQYVHGMFTQLAHRMHQPQDAPLHDLGFAWTPELGPDYFWVSESIFGSMFALFICWTFSPFVMQRKKFYTAVLWSRLLMVLVACQALRIITFTSTQLPGPAHHCRADQPTAHRAWPEHWTGHLIIDPSRGITKSCGDLIFSSHTIFVLTGVLAYTEYGAWLWMKCAAWFGAATLSFLIICSRKHYTVDIVVAWYAVPMVFYTLGRRWTTRRPMSDFLVGGAPQGDVGPPHWTDALDQIPPYHETYTELSHKHQIQDAATLGQQQQLSGGAAVSSSGNPAGGGGTGQRTSHHRKGSSPPDSISSSAIETNPLFASSNSPSFRADGGGIGGAGALSVKLHRALGTGGTGLIVRPRSSMGLAAAGDVEEGNGGALRMAGAEEGTRGGASGAVGRASGCHVS